MAALATDVDLFRAEIARVLASPDFASSRQLQDFLRFTSEKSFAGVNHLDQTEIALAVLGRGSDFNPTEDAAVRKMASQVRQRLEHYYSRAGNTSELVVALPVRSYLPTFERRFIPPPEETRETPTIERPRSNRRWVAIAAWLGIAVISAILYISFRPQPVEGARSLEL